jgi:hypothetical protein
MRILGDSIEHAGVLDGDNQLYMLVGREDNRQLKLIPGHAMIGLAGEDGMICYLAAQQQAMRLRCRQVRDGRVQIVPVGEKLSEAWLA